jgi:hypothetical protein
MKKSFIEIFINKNRAAFDDETPSPLVWDKIEKNISATKPIKVIAIHNGYKWMIAAAVVGVIFSTLFFVFNKDKKLVEDNVAVKPIIDTQKTTVATIDTPIYENPLPANVVADVEEEENLNFKENDVSKLIKTKQSTLKSVTKNNTYLYKQFSGDLKVLEQTYQELKKLSAVTPNRDLILKAMMQNLQLQAELLNRQLTITNKFENNKKQKNEKNTIQSL